jgi:hypothetical protein
MCYLITLIRTENKRKISFFGSVIIPPVSVRLRKVLSTTITNGRTKHVCHLEQQTVLFLIVWYKPSRAINWESTVI